MIKIRKLYDLTQPETYTLTWPQLESLALRVAESVIREQAEYFAEHYPCRTQTANKATQTALLKMEALSHVKH